MQNLLTTRVAGKSWGGMPEGTVMGHIHLHVAELVKTEEFYVKGLGLDVVTRFPGQALFLSMKSTTIMLQSIYGMELEPQSHLKIV